MVAVSVPPTMDDMTANSLPVKLNTVENQTAYLDCLVIGSPPPTILWLKDGVPLMDFPIHKVRELSGGMRLEVRSIQVVDQGRYTCVATNTAGDMEKHFDVDVWGEFNC